MEHEDSVMEDEDTGRAVRVRWIDSGLAVHGWQIISDLPANVESVETVALWMGENEKVVMLGSTRSSDGWLGVQLIWKPSIISKEWL